MANCARRVLKYLSGTQDLGIEYSPERERDFEEAYRKTAEHADNAGVVDTQQNENPIHTFTDASFGVVFKTMRSISGVVVYLYGTPVAWRSKVQTVFASSTTESEFIALSEGVEMEESIYGLLKFPRGAEPGKGPLHCDSRGAVLTGRKGPYGTEQLPRKTRHVALRCARVLPHADRLWFCPTDIQLADGATKSTNRTALLNVFGVGTHPPLPENLDQDMDDLCQDLDLASYYIRLIQDE